MSTFDKNLCLLPEFRHLKDVDVNLPEPVYPEDDIFANDDEVLNLIFAPDPITGIPRSDIAIMMSRDASPEVREYIQRVLYSSSTPTGGTDDADFAIDSIKDRRESVENYAKRLKDICANYDKREKS